MTEKTPWAGREVAAGKVEPPHGREECVLLYGLERPKAGLFKTIFMRHGISTRHCADVSTLCSEIEAGAGLAIVESRKLKREDWTRLSKTLARQPAWSDFPLIILTDGKIVLDTKGLNPNPAKLALFLDASVSATALLNAVRVSLRNRRRQYELRDKQKREPAQGTMDLRQLHALAEQRVAELNAVIESMPDAVFIGNEKGMTKCNTNALKQLGISSLEELQSRLGELNNKFAIRWPDGRRLKPEELQFARALRGELAINEVIARKVDTGEDVYLRAASAPVMLNGKIIGAVAVNSDITERKRSEEALREARDRVGQHANELEKRVAERTQNLKASVQSLEGVLYHVAHDLRAPLRSMQGFTTILMEEYGPSLGVEGADYARRISGAASRMDRLIQDLLVYGRLAHAEVTPTVVDLNRQIKIVLGRMTNEIEARKATVRVRRSLPAVYADPHVLDQILTQLVNNAMIFISPGARPKIHIQAETRETGMVRISVQDNGIGIAPEHHERIFRVFERLQTGDVSSGTGIGLAVVRKGAERMGGTAGVESKLGSGSCFWIDLPATPKK